MDEMLAEGNFYFIDKSEGNIENEYQFNSLMTRTEPTDLNERVLDLKIKIKGEIFST